MNPLIQMLSDSKKFDSYISDLKNKKSPVELTGLTDVSKAYFTYGTSIYTKKKICIITYNEIQAKSLVNNIQYFTDKVAFIPKREIVTYDYIAESKDLPNERIDALNKLYSNEIEIVVTTIESLMQRVIPKNVLYKQLLNFKIGKNYDLEEIKKSLVKLGYVRYDLIEAKGQFSIRGGILDIALTDKIGVRIEFWGDEIDSIRYFNINNQRSTQEIKEITIYPSNEFVLEKTLNEICTSIENKYDESDYKDNIKADIELIKAGNYVSKIDKYYDSFYSNTVSLLEYISDDYIIVLDEIKKVKARCQNILLDNENIQKMLIEKEKIVPEALKNMYGYEELINNILNKQTIYLEKQDIGFIDEEKANAKRNGINLETREVNFYKSNMELFLEEVENAINEKKRVIVLGGNEKSAKKISLLLLDKKIPHKYIEKLENEIPNNMVIVSTGFLSTGFEIFDMKLLVISSQDLFSKDTKKRRKVHSEFSEGEKVVFQDLKVGDYVVHKTHGIGQFIGVNTISADNITKDYIKIRYRDDDILYIPTNQLDNIRKYIGGGENSPKLNRLGSKEWSNTKKKVKSNLQEVARNLIELYAKRQKIKGFAFTKDTPWQTQFEDSFPYVETNDQLRCIEEVKKDMEKDKPMDRLLCGDVGYGKTEVAIRAAFKAVMNHKQVAYLVPTTILANQQYEYFKQRMEDFAVNVELLNRFRTKKEQDAIIKKLKLGEIDVIIGTHRILSKDVEFRDLGLLIIDEEHRFGVKDKEKIKELKTNIDVLTMTATPIPRTLHMSIVGVRDMSVIYEPPRK